MKKQWEFYMTQIRNELRKSELNSFIGEELIRFLEDEIKKSGKEAKFGEIRTWGGIKYKKIFDGKAKWVRVDEQVRGKTGEREEGKVVPMTIEERNKAKILIKKLTETLYLPGANKREKYNNNIMEIKNILKSVDPRLGQFGRAILEWTTRGPGADFNKYSKNLYRFWNLLPDSPSQTMRISDSNSYELEIVETLIKDNLRGEAKGKKLLADGLVSFHTGTAAHTPQKTIKRAIALHTLGFEDNSGKFLGKLSTAPDENEVIVRPNALFEVVELVPLRQYLTNSLYNPALKKLLQDYNEKYKKIASGPDIEVLVIKGIKNEGFIKSTVSPSIKQKWNSFPFQWVK